MATYHVETDKGTYEVETEDPKEFPSDTPNMAPAPLGTQKSEDLTNLRGNLEPGIMNETEPVESRLLGNTVTALSGATTPSALTGLAKAVGLGNAAETGAKYAGRFGENQMGKLHGTSPIQFKQLGREQFGPSMRASYDLGDANLLKGSIGREQAINDRVAQLGSDIGDLRQQAASAGPGMTPPEMAGSIKQELGADYAPGGKHFGEQGTFESNLANIEKMPEGGIEPFAQRASEMHQNAAGNKLVLPAKSDAEANIANQMSHINDTEIANRLPPELQEDYLLKKEQFGYAKNLQPMELRGEAREALGTSPNTAFGFAKKALHTAVGGPKLGAQAGFGTEKALTGLSNTINSSKATIGGITANLMSRLTSNPQSLGQYAAPLLKAAQTGGNQGLAATHYILSTTHPEYNKLINDQQ